MFSFSEAAASSAVDFRSPALSENGIGFVLSNRLLLSENGIGFVSSDPHIILYINGLPASAGSPEAAAPAGRRSPDSKIPGS